MLFVTNGKLEFQIPNSGSKTQDKVGEKWCTMVCAYLSSYKGPYLLMGGVVRPRDEPYDNMYENHVQIILLDVIYYF